jgi:flavodoxin|tara:strand:- start:77 stop:517 length:441 start_codon:yes stop_codon:yes gene_type:complete
MKTLLLYGSTNNSTKSVVESLSKKLSFPYDVVNVKELSSSYAPDDYDLLLFFAPTYGDDELQDDMERFLVDWKQDLSGKYYAICELGNYYGYDDFSYGAMNIIKTVIEPMGAKEFIQPVSMDSLPKKDWELFDSWCDLLNKEYHNA